MKKKYETPSIVETISEGQLVEKASVTVAQAITD
jgi:hypothetical protein